MRSSKDRAIVQGRRVRDCPFSCETIATTCPNLVAAKTRALWVLPTLRGSTHQMAEVAVSPRSSDIGSDSRASRVARQRQQRSMLRTSNLPLEEAAEQSTAPVVGSELQILRAEMVESGATISRLQTQLKQSDAEIEEMGSATARMAEELRQMQEKASAMTSPRRADGPMAVSISLPSNGTDVSVKISLADEPVAVS